MESGAWPKMKESVYAINEETMGGTKEKMEIWKGPTYHRLDVKRQVLKAGNIS